MSLNFYQNTRRYIPTHFSARELSYLYPERNKKVNFEFVFFNLYILSHTNWTEISSYTLQFIHIYHVLPISTAYPLWRVVINVNQRNAYPVLRFRGPSDTISRSRCDKAVLLTKCMHEIHYSLANHVYCRESIRPDAGWWRVLYACTHWCNLFNVEWSEISFKTPTKRKRRPDDNIKMNLIVPGCEHVDFLEVAKDS
jgi:hypothetical protein